MQEKLIPSIHQPLLSIHPSLWSLLTTEQCLKQLQTWCALATWIFVCGEVGRWLATYIASNNPPPLLWHHQIFKQRSTSLTPIRFLRFRVTKISSTFPPPPPLSPSLSPHLPTSLSPFSLYSTLKFFSKTNYHVTDGDLRSWWFRGKHSIVWQSKGDANKRSLMSTKRSNEVSRCRETIE